MARFDACVYTNVSTITTILTTAGHLFGVIAYNNTTGAPRVQVLDAKTTAAGVVVAPVSVGISTGATEHLIFTVPVACSTGIHLNWVAGTSGADGAIVFFSRD